MSENIKGLFSVKYGNIECLVELLKNYADSTLANGGRLDVLDFLVQIKPKLQDIINYVFEGQCHLELKDDHLKIWGSSTEYDIQNLFIFPSSN